MTDPEERLVDRGRLQELTDFTHGALGMPCAICSEAGDLLASTGLPTASEPPGTLQEACIEVEETRIARARTWVLPGQERDASLVLATLVQATRVMTEMTRAERREQAALRKVVALHAERDAALKRESLLEAIIDTLPTRIFAKDAESTFLFLNRSAAEGLGRPREDLIGTSFRGFWSEELENQIRERDEKVITTGIPSRTEETVPFEGGVRTLLTTKVPLRDEEGRIYALAGASSDITDVKVMEERLREAEKMEAIGRLAGAIAQDFNNQLVAVLGYASLLTQRLREPALQGFARGIMRAAQRSSDLVAQLMAFARKGRYVVAPLDVHDLIDEVVETLQQDLDCRITIQRDLQARPSVLPGDRAQIRSALLSLATNALDAMPDGGTLTLATHVEDIEAGRAGSDALVGRHLSIEVLDTGTGMDEEIRKRIFEPFFTTKEGAGCAGLGLASVLGTAKSHHGTVVVESTPGSGSRFRLILPVPETMVEPGEPEGSRGRDDALILLVDDDETVREVTADVLEELGYRVRTCENGAKALALYRQTWHEIDLVIVDRAESRTGESLTVAGLRKINPAARVLVTCGYTPPDCRRRPLEEGAVGFIQKPFMLADLARATADALEGREDEPSE